MFRTLYLIDPTPEQVAEMAAYDAAEKAAREKAEADLAALIAHKARWAAMTREERKEAMSREDEDEVEG